MWALFMPTFVFSEISITVYDYEDLKGWSQDRHEDALEAFLETCPDLDAEDWKSLCAKAQYFENAQLFFEAFFLPVKITDGTPGKFTGYYEPELSASRYQSDRFRYPIYKMPDEARGQTPWKTRREIGEGPILRDYVIAWAEDPVDLMYLQIQGSGRLKLEEGGFIRLGYSGSNGHDFKSIGTELVRQGIYEPHQASQRVIKNWVKRNPIDGKELIYHNPSYVFFREVTEVPPSKGPQGAMNRSLTPLRSIAIDPSYVPLGAPVWIEKQGVPAMNRLMIAQDTGSVIKGAQRADVFFGFGQAAGQKAGKLKDKGSLFVLLPSKRALALLPERTK